MQTFKWKGEWVRVLADSRVGAFVTVQFPDGRTERVNVDALMAAQ